MDDCTINQEKSLVQQYSSCSVIEKPIVPYSQTYKRKRASSVCEEAKDNGGCWMRKKHQSGHTSSTKLLKTKRTDEFDSITNQISPFKSTCFQHNRMKPIKLEEDLDSYSSAREVKGNGVRGSQMVTEADKARTLASTLSKDFAEKFITKEFEKVIFQGTDGRTWPVKCTLHSNAKLSRGWSGFARDNHVVEGDVCAFELINRTKKLLKVIIFRVKENIKCE